MDWNTRLLKLKSLDIVVAAKVCYSNNSKKAFDVETFIGMTVGGHPNFPFVYGFLNETTIIMQFFEKFVIDSWIVSPNLSTAVSSLSPVEFKAIKLSYFGGVYLASLKEYSA